MRTTTPEPPDYLTVEEAGPSYGSAGRLPTHSLVDGVTQMAVKASR